MLILFIMEKNVIPIVFATNDNYVKPMLTCIISALYNKKKDTKYEFHILHSGLSDKNENILQAFSDKKNITINLFNVSEYIKHINLDDYMRIDENYTYITGETFYRFFMPSIFPQYDKMLYLDCDTLVLADLTELFNTDLEHFYLGGIRDLYIMSQAEHLLEWNIPTVSTKQPLDIYLKEVLDIQDLKYCNAGVLLFNLNKMREDNIEQKLLEYAQTHLHLEYQDQDILNTVCKNFIKELPLKFNKTNFPQLKRDKNNFNINFSKLEKETIIKHYADKAKPWTLNLRINPENLISNYLLWWKYFRKTPLYKIKYEYIFYTNIITSFNIKVHAFIQDIYWLTKKECINIYWWVRTFFINTYWWIRTFFIRLYWWIATIVIKIYWTLITIIYWHIIVALYWKLRHLCWLIFIKYTFRPLKRFYTQVIKKFFNRIIKTFIKHSKKIFGKGV